jgi:hypothetical protein
LSICAETEELLFGLYRCLYHTLRIRQLSASANFVTLSLLELLVAIELKIVLVQFQAEMGKVEALGGTGP